MPNVITGLPSHKSILLGYQIQWRALHEPDFFAIPEKQAALANCLPRVERWVAQFLDELEGCESR